MKDMKIGSKIFFAFALVIILAIFLGFGALTRVDKLADVADNYAHVTVPEVTQLWTARRAVRQIEESALEATIVMTQAELDAVEQQLLDARETFEAALTQFETLAPQFKDRVDRIHVLMEDVTTHRTRLLEECAKFTEEGNAAAYSIYRNEYTAAFEAVVDEIISLSDEVYNDIELRYQNALLVKSRSTLIVAAILVALVAVAVIMTLVLNSMLTKPIIEIETAMKHVENGDFDKVAINWDSSDELGILSDSVRNTIGKLDIIIKDQARLCHEMGSGNFCISSEHRDAYTGEYEELLLGLRYIRDTLTDTLTRIESVSEEVLNGSQQVADGSQTLAQGATEQASSVQELLASMTELANKAKNNADHANMAKDASGEADKCVTESKRIMKELTLAMDEIDEASNEINKVVKSIDDIAFQTNILALNAAVEAARAGAAGRGFAVVADEVRSLAVKSAEAVQTTTAMIQHTLDAISKGSQLAHAAADALNTVIEKSAGVGMGVEEIVLASEEQQIAVDQMTIGIEQISTVVQNTSATAEESAAASQELSSQADQLKQILNRFKLN
ncbi:MAG: MCP four helix bundle domain-containing protein [Oscillospiraceae bacterium]|nr:MCP four helix bundle domain-containing protein [Oscillospiraceae bacterium]